LDHPLTNLIPGINFNLGAIFLFLGLLPFLVGLPELGEEGYHPILKGLGVTKLLLTYRGGEKIIVIYSIVRLIPQLFIRPI